jgi:glucose-1-phosphate thymidylyltransferase
MNVVIPMAGMGKRLRPHTLNIPKPLVEIAGKPVVEWLVEEINHVVEEEIEEIGFVVGRFGDEVEKKLVQIAERIGAKSKIYYQDIPLGTGHAVYCAEESLRDDVVVAFADTLFDADFKIDPVKDGTFWVKEVDNPESFGVVKTNSEDVITEFIEKPKEFVSNKALIGIYYFKNGLELKDELEYIVKNNVRVSGEFQLTTVLENLKNKGRKFQPGTVNSWMDFGNYRACLDSMKEMFRIKSLNTYNKDLKDHNEIIEPVMIEEGAILQGSKIGPFVYIQKGTSIIDSAVSETIIYQNSNLKETEIHESMIGESTTVNGFIGKLSLGSFSEIIK